MWAEGSKNKLEATGRDHATEEPENGRQATFYSEGSEGAVSDSIQEKGIRLDCNSSQRSQPDYRVQFVVIAEIATRKNKAGALLLTRITFSPSRDIKTFSIRNLSCSSSHYQQRRLFVEVEDTRRASLFFFFNMLKTQKVNKKCIFGLGLVVKTTPDHAKQYVDKHTCWADAWKNV